VLCLDAKILLHHRRVLGRLLCCHAAILTKQTMLNIMDNELIHQAEILGQLLKSKGLKIAVAESCTGGGICQLLTEIPGSSAWFECGFITYSNLSKIKMLGVKPETLKNFGAVSKEVANEMAEGAFKNSEADYAVSVTGIAGPDGGSVQKPVGTVFIALQNSETNKCYKKNFAGNRHEVRQQAMLFSLGALLEFINL
jgi:nicotinamide-nucleotide amidase